MIILVYTDEVNVYLYGIKREHCSRYDEKLYLIFHARNFKIRKTNILKLQNICAGTKTKIL